MGARLAVAVTLLSLLCLFSEPLYQSLSWKGGLPASIRSQTTLIPLDRATTDTLSDMTKYHAIRVSSSRMLRINLSSREFDPVLTLYRATPDSLVLIEMDDDDGDGNDARIERCLDVPGSYVLKVTAFGTSIRRGTYEIRPDAAAADCAAMLEAERQREREAQQLREQEEARRREEARSLYRQGRTVTLDQSVQGALSGSSVRTPDGKPFESWELVCAAGQSFQLDIEGIGYDAYARIVNAEGAEVASNDDGGGSLNPRINYTCPSAGSYFLVSTSYTSSASGRYTMRVSRR